LLAEQAPGAAPATGWESWLSKAGELLTAYGLRVVGALVFLAAAWIASRYLVHVTVRALTRARVEITLAKFLSNLLRWGLLALVIITCLGMFGVPATSFVAVLGTAGLAIGLALQGSLSHMAAGVMLMLFRPFKVGDMVVVSGQRGVVEEIELFTTRLNTPDNRRVIIPNGQVFGAIIENITHHCERRIDIPIGVSYAADIARTRAVLTAALKEVPGRVESKPPEATVLQFGPSSVDWQAMVWVKSESFGPARQAALQSIKESLERAGLEIPFPQVVVHAPAGEAAPLGQSIRAAAAATAGPA
jgi:small conductance mechanosensitive channel